MRESSLMAPVTRKRLWLALPAAAMALGWGLRGYIGGGPLGAMIPGAMVALLLAALLQQSRQAAWLAACGALGIGLGGQMTYGQTVGLALRPETFWWAMLGFAIKGGAWGLAGGAVFGTALLRDRPGWSPRRFHIALAAMLAATWAGWRYINAPKLYLFFGLYDKPREEVWAGLILGALAFLSLFARGPFRQIPLRFAAWPALAGAAGFPLGAALQVWGRQFEPLRWLDWWKAMEFTFGALLGLGFGFAAWLSRRELTPDHDPSPAHGVQPARALLSAVAAALLIIGIEYRLDLRFNYSLAAAIALAASLRSHVFARQVALTVTAAAFVLDLAENKAILSGTPGWLLVLAAALNFALWSSARRGPRAMFLFLTWSAVAVSFAKAALPPHHFTPGHLLTQALFLALALVCTRWSRALHAPATSEFSAVAS